MERTWYNEFCDAMDMIRGAESQLYPLMRAADALGLEKMADQVAVALDQIKAGRTRMNEVISGHIHDDLRESERGVSHIVSACLAGIKLGEKSKTDTH